MLLRCVLPRSYIGCLTICCPCVELNVKFYFYLLPIRQRRFKRSATVMSFSSCPVSFPRASTFPGSNLLVGATNKLCALEDVVQLKSIPIKSVPYKCASVIS